MQVQYYNNTYFDFIKSSNAAAMCHWDQSLLAQEIVTVYLCLGLCSLNNIMILHYIPAPGYVIINYIYEIFVICMTTLVHIYFKLTQDTNTCII